LNKSVLTKVDGTETEERANFALFYFRTFPLSPSYSPFPLLFPFPRQL
jgi:hypothetical protein